MHRNGCCAHDEGDFGSRSHPVGALRMSSDDPRRSNAGFSECYEVMQASRGSRDRHRN